MNKVECAEKGTSFVDVGVGDCFTLWDEPYMKIQGIVDECGNIYNAVNITDGHICCFNDETYVEDIFRNATITIS